jgi:hypothetical protein
LEPGGRRPAALFRDAERCRGDLIGIRNRPPKASGLCVLAAGLWAKAENPDKSDPARQGRLDVQKYGSFRMRSGVASTPR